MGTPSQGAQAKMCMDTASIGVSAKPFEFISETLAHSIGLIDHGEETIRGTRSHAKERVSQDVVTVGGWTHHYPTFTELDTLLYYIFGTAESADVFAVAETVPAVNICIDRVAKVPIYAGCKVNQALFISQKNKRLKVSIEWYGVSMTEGAAGSFPSGVTPDLDAAMTHQMGVFTWNSTNYDFSRSVVAVNNHLQREYNNSSTANVTARDRSVFIALETPYTSDETALYTTPTSSSAGAAARLKWTNGNQSLQMDFANLKFYPRSPGVRGKTEIRLPLRAKAFTSSTTKEIVTTNDATA